MSAHQEETPGCAEVHRALALLGRAWAGAVLWSVLDGASRYGDIRQGADGVSDAVLSARLKDLCEAGLLTREVDAGPPVQVRYFATDAGRDARTALSAVRDFAHRHPQIFG